MMQFSELDNTTMALLEFLNERRPFFVGAMDRCFRKDSPEHVESAWQKLQLNFWTNKRLPIDYRDETHLRMVCLNWLQQSVRWEMLKQRQSRGHSDRTQRLAEYSFTECARLTESFSIDDFTQEDARVDSTAFSGERQPWFIKAMDALTDRQHAAVQMCVLHDLTGPEAGRLMGIVSADASKRDGLAKLRKMFERGDLIAA